MEGLVMKYELLTSIYYKDHIKYEQEYRNRFEGHSTYHIPLKISGYDAFVVATTDIVDTMEVIYKLNNKINDLCNSLPSVAKDQYVKICLIDEVVETNDIEGVRSTKKEIANVLKSDDKKLRFNGLVKKYAKLIVWEKIPLYTSQDILNLYNEIVAPEISVENKLDGKMFRKETVNVVTSTDKVIHSGVTPEKKLIEYLDISLNYLNNGEAPDLIKIAVFHYLFGYIHPFYDGNGRTSRFISSYLLRKFLNELISFRIAYIIKSKNKRYYEAFEIGNNEKGKGDLTPFVQMFLNVIAEAAQDLVRELSEALEKINYYDNKIAEQKSNLKDVSDLGKNILFILVQATLFEADGLRVADLIEPLGKSVSTIRSIIKNLEELEYVYCDKRGHKKFYKANLSALDILPSSDDKIS